MGSKGVKFVLSWLLEDDKNMEKVEKFKKKDYIQGRELERYLGIYEECGNE